MPPSGSEPVSSFDRLHPEVRRWIREQGWTELREIQDLAIQAILRHESDVVIAAATAAGKTEAAFLPLLSQVAGRRERGLSILYVSPLKALINDQFRRLDQLCERLEIPVARWHGDAPQSGRRRLSQSAGGIALITPESIEALFLRRSSDAGGLLGSLDAIVIDELHAFLHGPRGLHLASLLRRIDRVSKRRTRRIGLSATLGDFAMAARWLNPMAPHAVEIVEAVGTRPTLKLQIRGYLEPPQAEVTDELEVDGQSSALDRIADHAFETLRGDNNLFFGGSRRSVEALADRLRRRSEDAKVPNEFFPHHGSLSKELREELEARLKEGALPTTAVATTTLELGIDIGSAKSVAQLGAPRSLSSLRQRLGRSGRRAGAPAILRLYVREKHLSDASDPLDRLRSDTIRAVAAVRLLLARFVEAPAFDPAVLTVTIHQMLSVIVERGGANALQLFDLLCASGPLSVLDKSDFIVLLRWLARPEIALIEQATDGTLMLGEAGERLTRGHDFYAVFQSEQEWRLTHGSRTLGTLPISNLLGIGSLLAFAGQRWRVTDVDDRAKVLSVVPHRAARLPKFDRLSVEAIDDRLAAEMRAVYLDADRPGYLDAAAADLLQEGRQAFADLGLAADPVLPSGDDLHLVLFCGTAMNSVIAVALTAVGFECDAHDLGVTVANSAPAALPGILSALDQPPSAEALSLHVKTLQTAKFDEYAPPELLQRVWARQNAHRCSQLPAIANRVREARAT